MRDEELFEILRRLEKHYIAHIYTGCNRLLDAGVYLPNSAAEAQTIQIMRVAEALYQS